MSYYDVMQVCVKGHQITARYDDYPEHRQDFCEKCGSPTIIACSKCKEAIRGHYNVPGVASLIGDPVPDFCHKCGEVYPWTKTDHEKKREDDKKQDDYWKAKN
ncbi:MAG: DUF2321 domain-containing protein [Candidatus Thorarchaeota archaeon]|nr:DUF2321 domain-containing protein [Candidatus Thorarchaeota archaeon]